MSTSFDPSVYTRAPKLTFASAITLARTLVAACPPHMPPSVERSCQRLRQWCERAESAWTTRHRELGGPGDEDTRPLDLATDRAWLALRDRAMAYAALPALAFPAATRAAELVQRLFPDTTLPFLRASYLEQLTAMQGILRRIDEDDLAKDLDAVCGPEFLANVRAMMPGYQAMVQALLARDGGVTDNHRDLLRGLQQAIVSYATKVCATVDDDDPTSAETARVALLAIDNLRAATPRRPSSGEVVASEEPLAEPTAPMAPTAPLPVAAPPATATKPAPNG